MKYYPVTVVDSIRRHNKTTFKRRLKEFEAAEKTETNKLRHYIIKENNKFVEGKTNYKIFNTNGTSISPWNYSLDELVLTLEKSPKAVRHKLEKFTYSTKSISNFISRDKSDGWELVTYFDGNLTINNLKKAIPEYLL